MFGNRISISAVRSPSPSDTSLSTAVVLLIGRVILRAIAAERARDAFALAPDNPTARLVYLATLFEQAACENGLDRPWDEKCSAVVEAARLGVVPTEEALKYAMAYSRFAAATVAARTLGQIGTAAQLLYQSRGPAALALASAPCTMGAPQ